MGNIILKQVLCNSTDFVLLCDELDKFLNGAIGGEDRREKYKKFNCLDTMDYVVAAYDNEIPVGCAALRKFSDDTVEVKRVFVREEYRGRNIGGKILDNLIIYSKGLGYGYMILETGDFLKASVRLYSRYGFEKIPNYGAYVGMPESLCMGRSLKDDDIIYCENKWVAPELLKELFLSVGWLSANYADRLSLALKNAGTVVSAWQGNDLVGLAEVLDDGELNAYIHYLLVEPAYQGRGIGSHIVEKIKHKYREYLYLVVICEKRDVLPFYVRNNFSEESEAVPLQIRTL